MGIDADCVEIPDFGELLSRARGGDAEAFCRIAKQHERRLLQQAYGLARDPATAEDLVSETFVEAWRCLSRYKDACRFGSWLFAILLHRHQKQLRRSRCRPVSLASLGATDAEKLEHIQQQIPAGGLSPAEEAVRGETERRLRLAVAALPEKHQRVLLLRFFDEATIPEIAKLLGCSEGTVKSRLHYALEKIRAASAELNVLELKEDT